MHTSVFLEEAIKALDVKEDKKYIDATYGAGGHSQEITKQGGKVLAIDLDPAVKKQENDQIVLVHGNFKNIENIATKNNFYPVSGILFDFGLSMDQIKDRERGFSYDKPHERLDMRLGLAGMTASEFLNNSPSQDLKELLVKYSEDVNAPIIANRIAAIRSKNPINTVGALTRLIDECVKGDERELKRTYARIFQAIRIIVNQEMENIQLGLSGGLKIVEKGGKIVVISFHSLEDRLVKRFGRKNSSIVSENRIKIDRNRKIYKFERSATLRVFTKS